MKEKQEMNPNEIKKGLECCNSIDEEQCIACPYYKTGGGCVMQMSEDALAYINQLEAEVERLTNQAIGIAEDYSNLVVEKDELFDLAEKLIKSAKSDVNIEFAERLKEKDGVPMNTVDNTVKEMVG